MFPSNFIREIKKLVFCGTYTCTICPTLLFEFVILYQMILLIQYLNILFFRYAKSVGAKHLLASAKLNKGVDELFLELAKGKFDQWCLNYFEFVLE